MNEITDERLAELRRAAKGHIKVDTRSSMDPEELLWLLDQVPPKRTLSIVRDSHDRDTRVHGLVLDEGNPVKCLRELLRQWFELATPPRKELFETTQEVLRIVGPDGTIVAPRDEP